MKNKLLSMCCEALVEEHNNPVFYRCKLCGEICDTFVGNGKEIGKAEDFNYLKEKIWTS